jgi:hypothetical protein
MALDTLIKVGDFFVNIIVADYQRLKKKEYDIKDKTSYLSLNR